VVIDSIPGGGNPVIHGAVQVENATYAVVECAYPDQRRSEKIKSDLFLPMNKEVLQMSNEHRDFRRKFYLADVEAIAKPLVVVPNIGGSSGVEYLVVKQRKEWVDLFKQWLESPHRLDEIGLGEMRPAQCFAY
jgi:hypothetical protein